MNLALKLSLLLTMGGTSGEQSDDGNLSQIIFLTSNEGN
jgi:hypothetical protein